MTGGFISLLLSFLPQGTAVLLVCAVCIGFFGVFLPRMEKKKRREEQEFYRQRDQEERERRSREERAEE